MNIIFGKLTWDSFPHEWFTIGGTVAIILMIATVAIFLTRVKRWKWLWNTWLTSTDPKKIGIMYIIFASIMLFRGGLDAGMIWLQQVMSTGASNGYLSPGHFQQIFSAHGNIMVFFVTMGYLFGLINIIVPLQIGTRDLAFPFLNTLSFWLYVSGAIFINLFFMFGGEFSAAGWLAMAPLSEMQYSPGVGIDYWIWSLQISGLGTLLGGINFVVTILKMRAPGMTLMKMPLFTWGSLCSMILVISVFPVLTITTALLFVDRSLGMHFFTTGGGGNAMMYVNLIWMWGHPEVYVLILPQFGIFSEVVSTFSRKRLAGYTSAVLSLIGITALSFVVWLHHFFTMGAGADVNAFFGIMTELITIPTAVQIYNWIATMWKGRIRFSTPMLYFLGFLGTFTFGGLAGGLLAIPPADFELHNSLFLVAHFHTMIIGGALFGIFAGIAYWFPKVMGFKLDERLGRLSFWFWLSGFFVSFIPLYVLGFMGATRRLDHYDLSTGWQPFFIISLIGFILITCGAILQVIQILQSMKQRAKNRDTTGDPWNGRTLEWATPSPVPFYNFAVIPHVTTGDAFWEMKYPTNTKALSPALRDHELTKQSTSGELPRYARNDKIHYEDIVLAKNTPMGIYISGFIFLIGFGFVWQIIWLIVVGFIGAITCVIIRTFDEDTEYVVKAEDVEKMEKKLRSHTVQTA